VNHIEYSLLFFGVLNQQLLICLLRQLLNYRLYFLLLSLRFIISSQFKELKIIQNKSSQIFLSQGTFCSSSHLHLDFCSYSIICFENFETFFFYFCFQSFILFNFSLDGYLNCFMFVVELWVLRILLHE
jgi:hypothetical protein